MNGLQQAADEWVAARDVIIQVLREHEVESETTIAVQIIARLATHEPPILLNMEGEA